MHHLHNLEKIILIQFLKAIGQLVHVDLAKVSSASIESPRLQRKSYVLISALLLLCALLTLGLDSILVARHRAGLSQ